MARTEFKKKLDKLLSGLNDFDKSIVKYIQDRTDPTEITLMRIVEGLDAIERYEKRT